tara:strand:- start:169 stop:438 length:270 start_codon:yes stop_codon:yes gene_type:complete
MSLRKRETWHIVEDGVGYGTIPDALANALLRLSEIEKDLHSEDRKARLAQAMHRIKLVREWAEQKIPNKPKKGKQTDGYIRRAPAISDG